MPSRVGSQWTTGSVVGYSGSDVRDRKLRNAAIQKERKFSSEGRPVVVEKPRGIAKITYQMHEERYVRSTHEQTVEHYNDWQLPKGFSNLELARAPYNNSFRASQQELQKTHYLQKLVNIVQKQKIFKITGIRPWCWNFSISIFVKFRI